MTRMKALGAIAILSAAIASPAFAQDTGIPASRVVHHKYYNSYNRMNAPYAAPMSNDEYWNLQNFGTTGRDPSRVGGEVPYLNPGR